MSREKNRSSRVVAADVIIQKNRKIVLLMREHYPFSGTWDIPGGLIEAGETVEKTAVREAQEETGLKVKLTDLLGVYSDPRRDPRFPSVSATFIAKPISGKLKGSREGKAEWVPVSSLSKLKLGFDHRKILHDYRKWLRAGGTYWSGR